MGVGREGGEDLERIGAGEAAGGGVGLGEEAVIPATAVAKPCARVRKGKTGNEPERDLGRRNERA